MLGTDIIVNSKVKTIDMTDYTDAQYLPNITAATFGTTAVPENGNKPVVYLLRSVWESAAMKARPDYAIWKDYVRVTGN